MSHIKIPDKKNIKDYYDDFFPWFHRVGLANGLAVREEWIRKPTAPVADIQLFGYRQFKKLWALREKPEGLVIYPDLAVRGAILAILEIGIEKVTSRMKFVLARAGFKFDPGD
jgi:DNA-binding LacI/PurR family transcriptional regulator